MYQDCIDIVYYMESINIRYNKNKPSPKVIVILWVNQATFCGWKLSGLCSPYISIFTLSSLIFGGENVYPYQYFPTTLCASLCVLFVPVEKNFSKDCNEFVKPIPTETYISDIVHWNSSSVIKTHRNGVFIYTHVSIKFSAYGARTVSVWTVFFSYCNYRFLENSLSSQSLAMSRLLFSFFSGSLWQSWIQPYVARFSSISHSVLSSFTNATVLLFLSVDAAYSAHLWVVWQAKLRDH